ncbi:glycosyltransferase family 1 protein [Roseivivax sp. THAF197b]|uniref:glycosyltransferase family 4 protein n=1 Tax=Roseivivax sp. THAF197b TaxID=2588299 RepID=UPI00126921AB|nr:glycosyltransferase family 1 protein [Roseivivax sp. THAF197b]QFS84538.1 Glycosyl transferases group 1 [Roseivivax sp. THAF197b]
MSVEPQARCLDLTRLVSRAGRQMTGVDRVERAYLAHLIAAPAPLFGLIRTALGYLLIDEAGCAAFEERLDKGEIGTPTLFSRLARRGDPVRAGVESDLRRDAIARARPRQLGRMLARHLPPGTSYLNVGHSSLTGATFRGLRAVPGLRIAVMIHDTIPLDLPQMQRPGSVPRFRALFDRVMAEADLIIANSQATADDIARHCPDPPEILVAHLGVAPPQPGAAPDGPRQDAPYFVALGTIEPRKNHAFLLDIWEDLVARHGHAAPHLLILGARGWNNDEVFARLDLQPPHVHELAGLDDAAVTALLRDSRGLLFPSLAEGFGLPPAEALQLGVPVLCNTLPVLREVLGDQAIYADLHDRYPWEAAIIRLAQQTKPPRSEMTDQSAAWTPPDWRSHFKRLLNRV